jgi:type VI secretion system secreted protein VgrG
MQSRELTVHLESEGTRYRGYRLRGREEISRLFEFKVDVAVPDSLDPQDLVGQSWQIVFRLHDEVVRRIPGIVAEVEEVYEPRWAIEGAWPVRVRLVPRVWRWSLRESCDVYVKSALSDILTERLQALGLTSDDYALRLVQNYPERELVVQYKESDLDFVSRSLEHLGASFYFLEKDGRDVVVFTDAQDGFDDGGIITYSATNTREGVYALGARTRAIPKLITLRDYNYRTPAVSLLAQTELPVGEAIEVTDYGDHFKTQGEGKWLADIRAQELMVRRRQYHGESVLPGLRAGAFYHIANVPRGAADVLVTSVEHEADFRRFLDDKPGPANAYTNRFTAIAKNVTFRPQRVTRKPRVFGVITGVIDAEATSTYAQLDDQGRYAVRFIFDTSDSSAGHASHRIRMIQPHAGAGYGMHFPLRPGVEVVLVCIDGDPDRPMIAGTVPNPQTGSPVTSSNAHRNVIRTGAGNEINIDDHSGNERIKMSTPKANTSFQLGAPNDPEVGAMLNTLGASTTVAQLGIGRITQLTADISLAKQVTSSGDISSVASEASTGAKAIAALAAIDGLASFVSGALQAAQAGKTLQINLAQQQQQKDTDAANQDLSKSDDSNAKLAADAAGGSQAAQTAYAQYNSDRTQYLKDLAQFDTDRDAFYQAQRQNADGCKINNTSTPLTGDWNQVVAAYTAATYAAAAHGPYDGAVYAAAQTVVSDQATLTADLAKLQTDATAMENAGIPAADVNADTASLSTYATAVDTVSKSRNNALDLQFTLQNDPNWEHIAEAETALTGENVLFSLFSALYALYTLIKTTQDKFDASLRWVGLGESVAKAEPRSHPTNKNIIQAFNLAGFDSPINTLGSDKNTTVYGGEKMLLWAPNLGIYANNEQAIKDEQSALDTLAKEKEKEYQDALKATTLKTFSPTDLLAKRKAAKEARGNADTAKALQASLKGVTAQGLLTLAADGHLTLASGGNSELVSSGKVWISAKNEADFVTTGGPVKIQASGAASIVSDTAAVSLTAASDNVGLDGNTVTATGTESASIVSGDWVIKSSSTDGISIQKRTAPNTPSFTLTPDAVLVDAGATGTITLQCGTTKIAISSSGIEASVAPSKLSLAAANATLKSGAGSVLVTSTGVEAGPLFKGG